MSYLFSSESVSEGHPDMKICDGKIAKKVAELFDHRPKAIERTLKLRQPMYMETAAFGHMGRKNEVVKKTFTSMYHEKKRPWKWNSLRGRSWIEWMR